MNNLLSYCGLVDTKIRASDKDLPVVVHDLYQTMDANKRANTCIKCKANEKPLVSTAHTSAWKRERKKKDDIKTSLYSL